MKKLLISLSLLFVLAGCSSSDKMNTNQNITSNSPIYMSESSMPVLNDRVDAIATPEESVEFEKKIITNSYIDIETQDYKSTIEKLNNAVKSNNGYVQSSSEYTQYNNLMYSSYTLRIPSKNYDKFLEECSGVGNITRNETIRKDITEDYYDTEKLLESLRAQEKTLIDMYSKANTIEDLIKIEDRLSNIRYQIGSAEAKMKNYDLLTEYSTIEINISEVKVLSDTSKTFIGEIKEAISGSLENTIRSLKDLVIDFIYVLPTTILIIVFVWISYALLKKSNIINNIKNKSNKANKDIGKKE